VFPATLFPCTATVKVGSYHDMSDVKEYKSPRVLRRPGIQLDNFSLVSANLLGNMSAYRALTDRQPKGTAVMVLPSPTSPLRGVYAAVARALRESGKTVWTKPHHAPQIPAVTPDKISAFNAIGAVPDCLAKARHGDGDASDRVLRFLTHLSAGICGESYVQVQTVKLYSVR